MNENHWSRGSLNHLASYANSDFKLREVEEAFKVNTSDDVAFQSEQEPLS